MRDEDEDREGEEEGKDRKYERSSTRGKVRARGLEEVAGAVEMTTLLAAKFISGSSGRAHFPAGPASCLATASEPTLPPPLHSASVRLKGLHFWLALLCL